MNSGKPTPRDYKKFPSIEYLTKQSYVITVIKGSANFVIIGITFLGIASSVESTIWTSPVYKMCSIVVGVVTLLLWCAIIIIFISKIVNLPRILGSSSKFTVVAISLQDNTTTNLAVYDPLTGHVNTWLYTDTADSNNLPNVVLQQLKTKKIFAITVAEQQFEWLSQCLVEQTVVDGKILGFWASVT